MMTRYLLLLSILVVTLFPLTSWARPSADFWNPFRDDTTNISEEMKSVIANILDTIGNFAGKAVSAIRIPFLQTQSEYKNAVAANSGVTSGQYNLKNISVKSLTGIAPTPDISIVDVSEEGKPCSGESGAPFWADDCSCHCSTGARPGFSYEATGYCPEDSNRRCEDCRDITRHDNSYTKVIQCRDDF